MPRPRAARKRLDPLGGGFRQRNSHRSSYSSASSPPREAGAQRIFDHQQAPEFLHRTPRVCAHSIGVPGHERRARAPAAAAPHEPARPYSRVWGQPKALKTCIFHTVASAPEAQSAPRCPPRRRPPRRCSDAGSATPAIAAPSRPTRRSPARTRATGRAGAPAPRASPPRGAVDVGLGAKTAQAEAQASSRRAAVLRPSARST